MEFIKREWLTLLFLILYAMGVIVNLLAGNTGFALFCGLAFVVNALLFYKRVKDEKKG